jgi:chorismate dehydratase
MKDAHPRPLRVGRIPYANLLPVFDALLRNGLPPGVTMEAGHPAELNRRLRSGELDVSPSSSIEYACAPERYLLVPGASVSARRRVMSVLLLSRVAPGDLPEGAVAVTRNSATSVALLTILLRRFARKGNPLERTSLPPAEALRRYPALLLIGDEAIRADVERVAPVVTDLGEWWRKETGLPFVFALWIVSRAAAARDPEGVGRFSRLVLAAQGEARERVDRDGVSVGPEWIPPAWRKEYWENLSWELGAEELAGLSLFYRYAAEEGIVPKAPGPEFLELSGR